MERLCSSTNLLRLTLTPTFDFEESYAKRSGGERKRTELVMLFALNDLVTQRSRFIPNFIILDEVFDGLDTEGLLSVQQLLQTLVERIPRVFIVTHSDIIAGLWNGTKDEELD
jgi:DNA repair exonuclease SbcCD ATPase subunit